MFRKKSLIFASMAGAAALAACTTTGDMDGTDTAASTPTTTSGTRTATPSPTPAPTPTPTPNPMVGGAKMYPNKTIVANASKASNLTTLVKAVQAAGLAQTLSGPGPFTVFAPTDDAFNRLPPGTVDTLLKPENKATLKKILSYHVLPGKLTTEDLKEKIEAGGGSATITTVEGEPVTLTLTNGNVTLTDSNGNKAYVSPQMNDVMQSNGVVHVINGVIVPTLGGGSSDTAQ
ncbi:fasciclin domain-containing protein [Stakelama sp. CBK3Z-3]|uniref:Fasciclin domain-containing protein n=1 Tax=Stakelama flava TaxID=2860338 RepID=A0ABS6XJI2_9SPHN|nr:fasciclin domain-containing protein [Stakelama flava]MBW4330347.1 fasciclin domain-containing protein [Stakelama flava]